MSTYKYTIKDIENCREEVTSLIDNNKSKIPNYGDFIAYPKEAFTLCYYDELEKKHIYPPIPNYFVRTNRARRLGYNIKDAQRIIELHDMDGNIDDFMYDIRTLDFKNINPNCNLDKLMNQTQIALSKVKDSFFNCDDGDFLKILKGEKNKIHG